MRARPALVALLAGCGVAESPTRAPHEALRQALRPTDSSVAQMFRYEPSDAVERYGVDGGEFVVHFTRAGRNAVPRLDRNDSGVPDYVEDVAATYEDVAATFQQRWGFRVALRDDGVTSNGGDGRFDVYLLDFAGSADGAFRTDECTSANRDACLGYLVQENDFAGYGYPSLTEAVATLASHEYFHATQAAYDGAQDVVVSEGTAVWATERYAPATSDFERYQRAFMARVDRSIDSVPPGPVPPSAYGTAIFFRFLSERYGDDVVRELYERLENGRGDPSEPADRANPTWLVQTDALLRARYQSGFEEAFTTFTTWNLFTGAAADPARAWREGTSYAEPAMSAVALPFRAFPLRVFYASAQYFRAPTAGRASLRVDLFDDPDTPGDETQGLVLIAALRSGGRNLRVAPVAGALDASGADEVIVAVVNPNRAGQGAVLSKRPGLCIGSADEVAACRAPVAPDAGAPADAGTTVPALGEPPLPAARAGCGHGMGGPPAAFLLASLLARFRRRRP
ncbi:MAG: hypothetical protein INH41_15395 [Myxococcaceae bacterium]|nr:hypothetical protein [Myxococcaceae bacterium]MCA3013763.1 hypothetical protein [Myxococcaceae bacterium]